MQEDLLLEFYQFYRAKNTRRDTHNTGELFFPNWKQQQTILPNRNPQKRRIERKFHCFPKLSPVSRIVPKTLRSALCSQNLWFLVKIEVGLRYKRIRKKLHSPEKKAGLKKISNGIDGYKYIIQQTYYQTLLYSLIVPKNVKGGYFDILTSILLQIIKNEYDLLGH